MTRIAYLVHSFDAGGLERCVTRLVNHLEPDRFHCLVICLDRGGRARDWIERPDVPVVELRKPPGNNLRIARQLAALLEQHEIELVHSHNWGTLLESVLACRRIPGIVHLHAEHGLELDDFRVRGWKRRVRRMAMRWALRRVDAVVACAESVRAWICSECRVARARVPVIPNGVESPPATDAQSALGLRHRCGLPPKSFVLGSVGRLVPLKNFASCIRATAILAQQGVDAHFVLIGDGPAREALELAAQEAGACGRVHFLGWQPAPGHWLPMLDVYVNSSGTEAMSLGILEAMSAGVPVVATDVGDSALLICGEAPCGVLVPPGDIAGLAAALGRLARDPALRRTLGASARRRHRSEYTVERMVDRYRELYEVLLASQRASVAV
jgi:glycosyltransferase involved in cell wall biosynthesis